MSEANQDVGDVVGDQLLLACQNGDAHTLQTLMSMAGLNLSMTTEDGVTLLMHAIIGAGKCQCNPLHSLRYMHATSHTSMAV